MFEFSCLFLTRGQKIIPNSVRVVSETKPNVWKNNLKSWKNPYYIWKKSLESWKNTYQKDDAGTNDIISFSRYSILSEDCLCQKQFKNNSE